MKAALDAQRWDLVLADYNLPQFDAANALRLLHRLPACAVRQPAGRNGCGGGEQSWRWFHWPDPLHSGRQVADRGGQVVRAPIFQTGLKEPQSACRL